MHAAAPSTCRLQTPTWCTARGAFPRRSRIVCRTRSAVSPRIARRLFPSRTCACARVRGRPCRGGPGQLRAARYPGSPARHRTGRDAVSPDSVEQGLGVSHGVACGTRPSALLVPRVAVACHPRLRGTFFPFLRASDSAIAMACLRLFTLRPSHPYHYGACHAFSGASRSPRPCLRSDYISASRISSRPFSILLREDIFQTGLEGCNRHAGELWRKGAAESPAWPPRAGLGDSVTKSPRTPTSARACERRGTA